MMKEFLRQKKALHDGCGSSADVPALEEEKEGLLGEIDERVLKMKKCVRS